MDTEIVSFFLDEKTNYFNRVLSINQSLKEAQNPI